MKRSTVVTLLLLLFVLLLVAWYMSGLQDRQAARELADSPATAALQDTASSTPFADFAGNPASLDQYLGQVLVVNSWASWSPFSATQLPLLANVVSEYVEDDVVLLAINRSEDKQTATSYLETISVTDQVVLIVDVDDRYYQAIGGYTMPETLIYDRRGNIVGHLRGASDRDTLRGYIDAALQRE